MPIETNAERLGRIKSNGLVGTQELGYGTVESVDGLREGDFQWLIEQVELAQKPNGVAIFFNESIRLDRENDNLRGRARELDNENKRLREALDFYAKEINHSRIGSHSEVSYDEGKIARQALEPST